MVGVFVVVVIVIALALIITLILIVQLNFYCFPIPIPRQRLDCLGILQGMQAQTDKEKHKQTDIATYRLNQPRVRLSEKHLFVCVCAYVTTPLGAVLKTALSLSL